MVLEEEDVAYKEVDLNRLRGKRDEFGRQLDWPLILQDMVVEEKDAPPVPRKDPRWANRRIR